MAAAFDMDKFRELVRAAVEQEIKKSLAGLSAEQQEKTRELGEKIAVEVLLLAVAAGPEEKAQREKRLVHYRNALSYVGGIVKLKTYRMMVNLVGNILAAAVSSALKL